MLNIPFFSKNENQKIYADSSENYALISAAEHSENNLMIDMRTLTSLPINEQVDILNKALPGLNLEPPKQDWFTLKGVGVVTILAALGYIIKHIICPSRERNSQSSSTNPSEPSDSNQGQLLPQSMAEASIGDQSTPRRRPFTRSMALSQEDRGSLNNRHDHRN